MKKSTVWISLAVLVCFLSKSYIAIGEEIYLDNGDKISGIIEETTEETISVRTQAMGLVRVNTASVREIISPRESTERGVKWKQEVSVGASRSTGNMRKDNFAGSFFINRVNKHVDEWTFKGNLFYSSEARRMDSQKWYSMGRYAYSFGELKKWYNFYRFEADHDRFSAINYRLVPAAGFGYWFSDTDKTKFMAEIGTGLERTYFTNKSKPSSEWVLIPRVWLKQEIFKNASVSQGISCYSQFENFSDFRIRSETAIDYDINNHLKLRFSIFDDYNSMPAENTKKNDLRAVTSLAYSF